MTRPGRMRRRGSAVLAVIVALVVLQLVVAGMVAAGARDHALITSRAESLRALHAAESGARMALRELSLGSDEDRDGVVGSISGDGNPSTGPVLLGVRINAALEHADASGGEVISRGVGEVSARGVRVGYRRSGTSAGGRGPGLWATYFTSTVALRSLAGVDWSATPDAAGPVPFINFTDAPGALYTFWNSGPASRFGARLRGKITLPQGGVWTFRLGSDDGSRLIVNGVTVINHDGLHGFSHRTGSIALDAGTYSVEVLYFQNAGRLGLTLAWQGPGVPAMSVVPPSAFTMPDDVDIAFPPLALSGSLTASGDMSADAATIDAYDASAGPYRADGVLTDRPAVSTNTIDPQSVQLTQGARVLGRLEIGPGGNPDSVVGLRSGAQITGGVTARGVALGIHRFLAPYVPMPPGEGSRTLITSQRLSANRTFQDLSIWGNNTVITISGHVTLRCNGSFQIGDRASIEVLPGSSLALFVAGEVRLSGQSRVNMNTGDPAVCWLFMTGADRLLHMAQSAHLVAHVRNPSGSLEIRGDGNPGSALFGSFHGKSMTMDGTAGFHGDVSPFAAGSGTPSGRPRVTSWVEEPSSGIN